MFSWNYVYRLSLFWGKGQKNYWPRVIFQDPPLPPKDHHGTNVVQVTGGESESRQITAIKKELHFRVFQCCSRVILSPLSYWSLIMQFKKKNSLYGSKLFLNGTVLVNLSYPILERNMNNGRVWPWHAWHLVLHKFSEKVPSSWCHCQCDTIHCGKIATKYMA
jgi:hypothetical protein